MVIVKIATLVGLSLFTAVIGLSPLASAVPFGLSEKENHGEYVSAAAKTKTDGNANHGSYVSAVAKSGITGTTSTVQSVPEPGTFLLFGVAFVVFAVWHQRSIRRTAA
jgi:predicted PurR-regulated permease PerM